MRTTAFTLLATALVAGCSQTSGNNMDARAAKTIVEIRGMTYPADVESDQPPKTYANSNPDDIKRFEQWLRAHRGNWQPTEGPPPDRRPAATCALIYGNGKTLDFAMDDHALISGNEKLPLSESDYQFVKQICLKR